MPVSEQSQRVRGGNSELSRRAVVGASAATVFLMGFRASVSGSSSSSANGEFAPNAFIRIDKQGGVVLIMPQVEMGQGTYTSISMILAEELDAAWENVSVEHAPPDERYINPLLTIQATGNSNSIRGFWTPLRKAGAAARACLIQAAAHQWRVPATECQSANSEAIHIPTGRKLAYGALVHRAAEISPPADPPIKDPAFFKLIGRPLRRIDTSAKVNGTAPYGIDAMPSGVKFATIAACPVLGGTVAGVDRSGAQRVPGVRKIVVLDNLVAVVGDHMWAAKCGLEALKVDWNDGPNGGVSSELIWSRLREASQREGAVAKEVGDADSVLGPKGGPEHKVVTAVYEMPLLAHACMEPLNCTLHVTSNSAEVWIGTQVIERVRAAVADAAGLREDQVIVHNHLLGGGFGRRLEPDMAHAAARIAQGTSMAR